ncbi:MAG TPA: GLPGLI family protein [Saprospiraceae bacterium]|nr:GLPGLI family protein [Saprospiraceae bacterium]
MKTFLIFLFSSTILLAQRDVDCKFCARYEFIWATDSLNQKFKSEEYNLVQTKGNTYFFNNAHEYNDSMYLAAGFNMQNQKDKEMMSRWSIEFNKGTFHSSIKWNKTALVYFSVLGNKIENYIRYRDFSIPMYYSCPIEIPKWEITNENDTINGLFVIKAFTSYGGRNYTAWFSPTIPINEGPYVFRNLPGLAVKVHDDENNFTFLLKWYKNNPNKCFVDTDIDMIHRQVSYSEWVSVRTTNYFEPRMPFQATQELKERNKKNVQVNGRYLLIER